MISLAPPRGGCCRSCRHEPQHRVLLRHIYPGATGTVCTVITGRGWGSRIKSMCECPCTETTPEQRAHDSAVLGETEGTDQ